MTAPEDPSLEQTTDEQLDDLMRSGADVDLDEAARLAAERLAAGAAAVDEQEADVADPPEPSPASPPRRGPRRPAERVLQALLGVNLVLLAVVLLLPTPAPQSQGTELVTQPDPFIQPPRDFGGLPTGALWDAAVARAGEGQWAEAAALLKRYLQTSPAMSDLERQLVYNQLALYLLKDGRLEESRDYSLRSQQLTTRTYLPADLLHAAEKAESQGMLTEMRASYARFLLQLRQAAPEQRAREAEAYLKLGDSYRLEAERAERQQQASEDDAGASDGSTGATHDGTTDGAVPPVPTPPPADHAMSAGPAKEDGR